MRVPYLSLLWGLGLCCWLMAYQSACADHGPPVASNGEMNLLDWDFEADGSVELRGEWAFYWQQLLEPEDFTGPAQSADSDMVMLPGSWNGENIQGEKLAGNGYATYRLVIKQKPAEQRCALKILNMSSAYTLWVNGRKMASNGQVGTDKASMTPQYQPQIIAFDQHTATTEIVIQVSNFHHRKGGAWNPLVLGSEAHIRKTQRYWDYFDLFLLGALFIMGVYHLGLFALRRKDPSTLYFGLFCLVVGARSLFYREMIISLMFPEMSWEMVSGLRYVLSFTALPLFALFIRSLFPVESTGRMLPVLVGIELCLILVVLSTPVLIYSYTMIIHQVVTLVLSVYSIWVLIKAIRNKRDSARWLLGGFFAFFIVILNDILADQEVIASVYLMPFGLLLFIFSQAFVLSMRFSRAYEHSEKLTYAYERFVPGNFLRHLNKEDITNVQLGDNIQRNMTILFSDIRSFTTISEAMTPQENFNFLNSYLERMEPIITEHRGFIDKYIGDEIMALFEKNADDAVAAGIKMLENLVEYNHHRQCSGYPPVYIGIGINTGELMLGIIGGKNRMDGTVISDAVNLASRMEELTKIYRTPLLISEYTYLSLSASKTRFIRLIDYVQVHGKTETIAIYEVFATDSPGLREAKLRQSEAFTQAVQFYARQQYEPATTLFQSCLDVTPGDLVAQVYMLRMQGLAENS